MLPFSFAFPIFPAMPFISASHDKGQQRISFLFPLSFCTGWPDQMDQRIQNTTTRRQWHARHAGRRQQPSRMPGSDYPINHGVAVRIMHPVAVLDWTAGRRPRAHSTRIPSPLPPAELIRTERNIVA
jgi:hypothetical protein